MVPFVPASMEARPMCDEYFSTKMLFCARKYLRWEKKANKKPLKPFFGRPQCVKIGDFCSTVSHFFPLNIRFIFEFFLQLNCQKCNVKLRRIYETDALCFFPTFASKLNNQSHLITGVIYK